MSTLSFVCDLLEISSQSVDEREVGGNDDVSRDNFVIVFFFSTPQ